MKICQSVKSTAMKRFSTNAQGKHRRTVNTRASASIETRQIHRLTKWNSTVCDEQSGVNQSHWPDQLV